MDKTEYEIARGERAAQLLADPIIADAFEGIEKEYINAWLESPVRDYEGREELYRLLRSLRAVQAKIHAVVDDGKVAKATLAEQVRAVGQRLNPFSS